MGFPFCSFSEVADQEKFDITIEEVCIFDASAREVASPEYLVTIATIEHNQCLSVAVMENAASWISGNKGFDPLYWSRGSMMDWCIAAIAWCPPPLHQNLVAYYMHTNKTHQNLSSSHAS